MKTEADIIFMPYNYLLDPKVMYLTYIQYTVPLPLHLGSIGRDVALQMVDRELHNSRTSIRDQFIILNLYTNSNAIFSPALPAVNESMVRWRKVTKNNLWGSRICRYCITSIFFLNLKMYYKLSPWKFFVHFIFKDEESSECGTSRKYCHLWRGTQSGKKSPSSIHALLLFLSKGQWTYGPTYCLSIDTCMD